MSERSIDRLIDLAGRRVVVTGGSRGIGAATARLFARAGAAVAISFRSRQADADDVLAELAEVNGEPHLAVAADLMTAAGVEELFARVGDAWGRLDCLVNNAGIWVENRLAEFDPARYEETMRVNVTAPFLSMRAALPLLREGEDPNVVNVTSTAGQRGEAGYSPYAASKGAMISATKAWSSELAPAIRVNSVAPGWVDTEMCDEPFAGDGKNEIAAGIPLGRVASPADVAGPILFLASPLARHVTGEILNVNGGSVLVG
ncbi:MAG TPA: SDR family oxidoreductase [Thermoanaerobaculia bacterium]|nr:SDR family oxidoreductase [Thermoanaerobaculia bacterium]